MKLLRRAALGIACLSLAACSENAPGTAGVTSSGGSGSSTVGINAPITVTAKPKFAYTGNQDGSLSGYAVNAASGVLTPLSGFPMSVGENPTAVAHDPQNRFLFVADIAADQLHVLGINATTGALKEISPSPYFVPAAPNSPYTVAEPVSLTVDPSGTHVYMVNQGSSQIEAYNLGSTGILTPVSGTPFYTGGSGPSYSVGAASVFTNAAGSLLYVQDTQNLYTFSINSTSGALTLLQSLARPEFGDGMALDPNGLYVYAVGSGSNVISSYGINAKTGLLTLATSSPMAKQSGSYTIAVSPTGQFAYTIEDNNYLVAYSIDNGVFTEAESPHQGFFSLQIGIDPSGDFLYLPSTCSGSGCQGLLTSSVSEFSLASTGTFSLVAGSPVPAGSAPFGITITSQ